MDNDFDEDDQPNLSRFVGPDGFTITDEGLRAMGGGPVNDPGFNHPDPWGGRDLDPGFSAGPR
jgi:hypothetical protein